VIPHKLTTVKVAVTVQKIPRTGMSMIEIGVLIVNKYTKTQAKTAPRPRRRRMSQAPFF
jgi:hypothetical protein